MCTPYTASEEEKYFIDKELNKLVKLNVLEEGFTDFSSPVMIVPKNDTKDK